MNKEYDTSWDAQGSTRQEAPVARSVRPSSANAVKQIVTIRLDVDMLEWFKKEGPGYQTRINQVLREHMKAEQQQQGQEAAQLN